eukprot:gene719-10433_t
MQRSFSKLTRWHWLNAISSQLMLNSTLRIQQRPINILSRCPSIANDVRKDSKGFFIGRPVARNTFLHWKLSVNFCVSDTAKLSSDSISRDGQIHLIDEHGKSIGLMSFYNARQLANEKELELYLAKPVSHQSPHAIYKLLSKKDIYEIKKTKTKRAKEINKKQKVKELSFSTDIGEQDFSWKINKMKDFLGEDDKVKLIINKKRRSKNQCTDLLNEVLAKLEGFGEIEGQLVETDNRVRCIFKPVSKLKN